MLLIQILYLNMFNTHRHLLLSLSPSHSLRHFLHKNTLSSQTCHQLIHTCSLLFKYKVIHAITVNVCLFLSLSQALQLLNPTQPNKCYDKLTNEYRGSQNKQEYLSFCCFSGERSKVSEIVLLA